MGTRDEDLKIKAEVKEEVEAEERAHLGKSDYERKLRKRKRSTGKHNDMLQPQKVQSRKDRTVRQPTDKRQRRLEMKRKAQKDRIERMKKGDGELYQESLRKKKESYHKSMAKESPEKRQKRLLRTRICTAVIRLKRKLQSQGLALEEIQRNVDELKERMENEPPSMQIWSSDDPVPAKRLKRSAEEKRQMKRDREQRRRAKLTEEELRLLREQKTIRERERRAKLADKEFRVSKVKRIFQEGQTEGADGNESITSEEYKRKRARAYSMSRHKNATPEQRKKWSQKRYLDHCAVLASLTREEREERRLKSNQRQRDKRKNYTPEERQKYLDCQKKSQKKRTERCKAAGGEIYKQHLAKLNKYYQNRLEKLTSEAPERRWRRLVSFKVCQAVRNLKKRMRKEGISEKEIDVCASALKLEIESEPMPPPETISKHKPRPRKEGGRMLYRKYLSNSPSEPEAPQTCQCQSGNLTVPNSNLDVKDLNSTGEIVQLQTVVPVLEASPEKWLPEGDPTKTLSLTLDQPVEVEIGSVSVSDLYLPAVDSSSGPDVFSISFPPTSDTQEGEQEQIVYFTTWQPLPVFIIQPEPVQLIVTSIDENPTDITITDTATETLNAIPISTISIIEIEPSPLQSNETAVASVSTSAPVKNWKCPKCKETMPSHNEFLEHYQSHKVNEESKSELVSKESPTSAEIVCENPKENIPVEEKDVTAVCSNANTSRKSKTVKLSFLCLKCPQKSRGRKSFKTHHGLLKHVEKIHPNSFWPCRFCKLLKYRKATMDQHVKICEKYFSR